MTPGPGIEPGTHWWKASALTTTPTLLPLNDSLLPGPPITKDLTAIFLRFRCRKYGFATDIGKAFLNISLDEQNRDASRFFWSRLTCVKAFVLRLVRNTRKQNQKKAALTTQELAHAQRFSIFST